MRLPGEQRPPIVADVELLHSNDIEGWKVKLQPLLPDFVFLPTDRYDEVPAYEASQEGMSFVILGVPEGEVGSCVLSFSCDAATAQSKDLSLLLGGFIQVRKQPSQTGYAYYSQELALALRGLGQVDCEAVAPPI